MKQLDQKKQRLKLSVIVPVYNSDSTIADCLTALCKQEDVKLNKDYEIVVVDDGSTDKTADIVATFPVRLVKHKKNKGRLQARLTGAKAAKTNLLVYIDARNLAASDLLKKASRFRVPTIAADLSLRETKYDSWFNTAFFLIRRRYYGKAYYAKKLEDTYVTKENFTRSPKGTTLLVIKKELFFKINPKDLGHDTNDDTLLFHNLIFNENQDLLRSKKLKIKYLQRSNMKELTGWLHHRGILFADYYIWGYGLYRILFILTLLLIAALILLAIFYPLSIFGLLVGILVIVSTYLSENVKDFFIVLITLPIILIIFYSGIISYSLNGIKNYFKNLWIY